MPMGDSDTDWGRPTRNFLYGPDKTKKTWWAAKAAQDGYNVVLIDGDDGASIIKQLPIEARRKILVVDVVNTASLSVFARFMATFMRGEPFFWDEQKKVSYNPRTTLVADHSHIYFEPQKFTMNDVVIIDSWTALAASLMLEWAIENKVELTNVEKEGDQFSLMGYQSRYLDYTLTKIKTFNCHMIVIGHETVYEKWQGQGKDRKMVEQRTQPFSSTGPHAKKIGSHFSNVMRFRKLSDISFIIDAGGDATTMGGCRQLAPQTYKWDTITPQTIFEKVGSKPTGEPNRGAIWVPAGANLSQSAMAPLTNKPVAQETLAQQQVVDANSASKVMSLKDKLNQRK